MHKYIKISFLLKKRIPTGGDITIFIALKNPPEKHSANLIKINAPRLTVLYCHCCDIFICKVGLRLTDNVQLTSILM